MDTIFVTLIGNMVIANRTQNAHVDTVLDAVRQDIAQCIGGTVDNGDNRYSVRVRTVITSVGK